MTLLVRPRAWWYNKVPLSVTLVLLLLDGRRLSLTALAALLLVVLTVCAVGNYGYALNDLFDVAEDERAGRANAAAALGLPRTRAIVGGSTACAALLGAAAAGAVGALGTLTTMIVTAAYSIPPLRLKERGWLAVVADALAAHVFPAVLALLSVARWGLHPVGAVLAAALVVWSSAAGLRGILSHLLQTAERDDRVGLRTLVHQLGARRLERFVVWVLLPLEAGGFGVALIVCSTGVVLALGVALYVVYEAYKTLSGRFRVTMLRPEGQPYVPLLEESFYKAWGPLVLALDCARADPWYLLAVPAYALLFRPHIDVERNRMRMVTESLRAR